MHALYFSTLALLICVSPGWAAPRIPSVTVEAGDHDRKQTIVTFPLPRELRTCNAVRHAGKTLPLQVDKSGRGSFVISDLKKGEKTTYDLLQPLTPLEAAAQETVFAFRDGTRLRIALARGEGGAAASPLPLLDYQAEPGTLPRENIKPIFLRGAYLHPIRTLTGKLVTDDYPPNHIHHHGVWWAWTHTEFDGRTPDFWNMGESKGRVEFGSLDDHWSGPIHAGFHSKQRFIDLTAPTPTTVLHEAWEVIVYAASPGSSYWIFDLFSRQRCATPSVLKLPEYRYGGLGVRGNWAWNGKTNAAFLTSEGETDRVKGNTQRGRWCDMGGLLGEDFAGIAILCHPENFRAPQPMRLHPEEPFFNFAPQQAGEMAIKPGETYTSRYRFVVHDGRPDKVELDRLWNDYSHPPVVTVNGQVKEGR
jgi:hypothetical protein